MRVGQIIKLVDIEGTSEELLELLNAGFVGGQIHGKAESPARTAKTGEHEASSRLPEKEDGRNRRKTPDSVLTGRVREAMKKGPMSLSRLSKEVFGYVASSTYTRLKGLPGVSVGKDGKVVFENSVPIASAQSADGRSTSGRRRISDEVLIGKVKSELKSRPDMTLSRLSKAVFGYQGERYYRRIRQLPGIMVGIDGVVSLAGVNGVLFVADQSKASEVKKDPLGKLYPPHAEEVALGGILFHVWKARGSWKVADSARVHDVGRDKAVRWEIEHLKVNAAKLTEKDVINGDVYRRNCFVVGMALNALSVAALGNGAPPSNAIPAQKAVEREVIQEPA